MKKHFFILFTGILILISCRSKKGITPVGDVNIRYEKAEMLSIIDAHNQEFTHFDSDFSFDFTSDRYEFSGTGKGRMHKDSIIWAVIKKIGFEVARIKITKDSFKLVNRFEGTFMEKDLNYLQVSGLLNITIADVQNIILGNVITPIADQCKNTENLPNTLVCTTNRHKLFYEFDPLIGRLKTFRILELNSNRQMEITYQKYREVLPNKYLPFSRKIDIQSPDTKLSLDLHFENILIDVPKEMKFSIPAHYEKM
ncbi:MAG: DUF4292 domain-containing protein [Saprospiraceae bacterium]